MKLHIGQGATVGAITVFPVWHDRHVAARRTYDTGASTLAVTEAVAGPSVPELQVTNTGERPVLVLDGQLFEGGWQHRMATRSTLVPLGAQMAIEVACVEQSRWHGKAAQTTRGRRASVVVRDGFAAGGQQEVWRRIALLRHRGGPGLADRVAGRAARHHGRRRPGEGLGRAGPPAGRAVWRPHRHRRAAAAAGDLRPPQHAARAARPAVPRRRCSTPTAHRRCRLRDGVPAGSSSGSRRPSSTSNPTSASWIASAGPAPTSSRWPRCVTGYSARCTCAPPTAGTRCCRQPDRGKETDEADDRPARPRRRRAARRGRRATPSACPTSSPRRPHPASSSPR